VPESLSLLQVVIIGICVLLTGASKTAMPVAGVVSGTLLAATLTPTVASAFLVPLLLVGDIFALARYRQHVQWRLIGRLLPGLVVGFAMMAVAFRYLDTAVLARILGALILTSFAMEVWRRRSAASLVAERPGPARVQAAFFGSLAGMTTMAANAGGTAMSLYLIAMRVPMLAFMGTSAWFFTFLNLAKVPIILGLGLVTKETLLVGAWYLPALFAGAGLGIWAFRRMNQEVFTRIALGVSAVVGAWLLIHG